MDDFTRFKFIRFLKHKCYAAKELRELVVEHIDHAGIKIGTVRTDDGGELEGEFQSLLKELGIQRETIPPHTPEYNDVVERAPGLLRGKIVALLRVIMRQAIIWYPTADVGEKVSSDTATKGGGGAQHGHYSPRPKTNSHYTSSLGSRETVSKKLESEQHEPEVASGPEGAFETASRLPSEDV